jgi:cytochrome c oxidase cbb3-type subunit 3
MACGAVGIFFIATLTSCERETRQLSPEAPAVEAVQYTPLTDYRVGGEKALASEGTTTLSTQQPADYEENAHAVAEGKRLYSQFCCHGCHAHGGGDMGPPLMDQRWIYGHRPEQIFSTIVEGRPNGMPSFGSKIPAYQIWQLAAYVRSMSGLMPQDVAPGRDDDAKTSPPENSADRQPPTESEPSPSAEAPK